MDTIGDFLVEIKNCQKAGKEEVISSPYSKIKFEIAKILKKEGFIEDVLRRKMGGKSVIKIILKYDQNRSPQISDIKRISKPSRRIYLPYKKIKPVKEGRGIAIVSTSEGLMTDREARKKKIGGEIICEVW